MSAAPNLLPYQARWVKTTAGVAAIEKSRRVGVSWAEAYRAVMHSGEGRGDNYYQSYSLDMARGFVADAADWAQRLQLGAEAVGEILIDAGEAGAVQAYRLRMASGKSITALASSARAWRSKGRPGDAAIIDEAAFVDDLGEVLKAALATRVWGGSVRVISTHNGKSNPFAALCRNLRNGELPGEVQRVTLGDAIEQGLYRRICAVTGRTWTPEAEAAWEAELRAEYGARAAEELDCIPSPGGAAWLAWGLIRAAEVAVVSRPEGAAAGSCWIGVDIARRRDLWVAAAVEQVGDVLWLRELQTLRDRSFAEQADVLAAMVDQWNPVRIAMDQTGMGEPVVESAAERHGKHLVEGVLLTAPRRLAVATALREALEDQRLRLPADEALRRDLHSVRAESGATGWPRLVAVRDGTDGHADRFWALALAVAAAASAPRPKYDYQPVALRQRNAAARTWGRTDDDDDGYPRSVRSTSGFRRLGGML